MGVAATLLFAGPGGWVPEPAIAQQRQPPRVSAPATVDPYPTATDARLGGDENQTRFVMDLTRKVELRAFTLADPYRVVIDLPQVTFKLPPKAGESGRGLVKAYRFGLVMQGGSRIVLDTGKPVRIDKAFVLEQNDSQPARLVLDLAQVDRETFLRTIALDNPKLARPDPKRFEREAPIKGDPRPLIVVDPGHGGIDHGTRAASGETEKQIVLDFALLLRDQLEKSGKYRVAMTRSDDTFIALDERVRMARARQAALFISIHADALKKSEGEIGRAHV